MNYQFPILPIIGSKEEAQAVAIAWQEWQSNQDLSMLEIANWQEYFTMLANEYGLTDEFTENGII